VEDDAVLALAGRDEDALAGTLELGVVGRLLAADATTLPLEGTTEEPDGTPAALAAELGATVGLSDPEGAAEGAAAAVNEVYVTRQAHGKRFDNYLILILTARHQSTVQKRTPLPLRHRRHYRTTSRK
jgi:hypothetical protein